MKRYILTICLLAILIFPFDGVKGQSVASANDCYAFLNNDSLYMGSSGMDVLMSWERGILKLHSISNKILGTKVLFEDGSCFFSIEGLTDSIVGFKFTTQNIAETSISHSCLKVELFTSHPHVEVKQVFRIYSGCPVLACDFFVRRKENKNIRFEPEETNLAKLHLNGIHWKLTSVEFFDRTDRENTLVKEHNTLSFQTLQKLRGNILCAVNNMTKQSLFVLKECPCSFSELNYPGYDFSILNGILEVKGIGVSPADLITNDWLRTYSVVLGANDMSEYGFLNTLRSYQEKNRKIIPDRDDMVMMNTWGDRNRDASIGEEFVKREIDECRRMGVTHFQIDDGWQQGRSMNTAGKTPEPLWDQWKKEHWIPSPEKFPNGFGRVTDYAKRNDVKLGLWFHPSNANNYATWEQDAGIILNLFRNYGIQYFKIDGVKLPSKEAEINLRSLFDSVQRVSDGQIVFNLDATDNNRFGYHYFYEYGNIFLENRYTDFGKYYPYWTLRNLWMLSKYVPPQKLQIEFLNKWRNADKYPKTDIFAPAGFNFDYLFAITMMAQPLAWFEGSGLPEEGFEIAPVIRKYREVQHELHAGYIFPIGDEPSGASWTGFQSINGDSGYFLIFRENNEGFKAKIKTYLPGKTEVKLEKVLGSGSSFIQKTDDDGRIDFFLPEKNSYVLYKYQMKCLRPIGNVLKFS